MNSVVQIAIGILILGAAFYFGSQLRQPKVDSVANELDSTETGQGLVWQKPQYEPIQTQSQEPSGLIEMPVAKKRVPTIPGPANLQLMPSKKSEAASEPLANDKVSGATVAQTEPRLPVPELKKAIVEPDFSQLASSFFEANGETALQDSISGNIAPLPRLKPVNRNFVPESNIGAHSTPKNRTMERIDIAPQSRSFDSDDFEPRLKDSMIASLPTEPYEIESLPIRHAEPKAVKKIPVVDENYSNVERNQLRPSPFGLTDDAKSRMVEVGSRYTNGLRLETNRFIRHRSKAGETLQKVSRQYFGRSDYYLDIYLANQDVLRNPGKIPAGTSLRIPIYD